MIKLKTINNNWNILCEKSVIDADSNNLSLNNIVEEIQIEIPKDKLSAAEEVKRVLFKCELITHWSREKETSKDIPFGLKIEELGPENNTLNSMEHEAVFPKGKRRLRHRIKMDGFLVKEPGKYAFKISAREGKSDTYSLIGEVPIDVRFKVGK
ncbi:MAG: hypothetical protein WD883_03280 [Candidatus Colwellbacteria bacterium]